MPLPVSPSDGKSFRILVVEDDASIAKLIMVNLRKAGFDARYAYDGALGWEIFRDTDPHLVLSDISMPGMDGHELVAKIRQVSTIPIILMTAMDTDARQMQGFKAGADDYVAKPFNPQLLTARVIAHLRRVYRYSASDGEGETKKTPETSAQEAVSKDFNWPKCGSCGYMAPLTKFQTISSREGQILACPNCKSRNLLHPIG